ncbi:quaternary ammonium compound-resistance protein SugE [Raineyella antarctica]|uniref:Quaternary ammonium compound-resistance protein SugE n=1 Tax=Raineyella antarctica TaxID=1577474 RepID=A0A1G6HA64_9ACTN|nr:multidrug efflux SMR transporter [Raineyella antarctica]SDB90326.1 quaternary ammonium compound-resistance protein SugE [Raineyella antarctica]
MAWLMLILSGVLEAVWATALSMSRGFRRPVPVLVFLVASVASMAGLGLAMRTIPTGTAYAVWAGVGAALTVVVGMVRGTDRVTLARVLLLVGLLSCVAGLKVVSG